MSNTIDIFSGRDVKEIERETEAERKQAIVENLELFDKKMAVYREAIGNGTLDSFTMCGIVNGVVADSPYVFLGDGGCFAKTSVLLSDLQIQMESYAIAMMIPKVENIEE